MAITLSKVDRPVGIPAETSKKVGYKEVNNGLNCLLVGNWCALNGNVHSNCYRVQHTVV